MSKWLKMQPKDFYAEDKQKIVFQGEKYVLKNGDYIEKSSSHFFSWVKCGSFYCKIHLIY